MSHGDQVSHVSADFLPLAETAHLPHRRRPAPHAAGLRAPVPPRGDPYAARLADPEEFPRRASAVAAAPGSWAISPRRRSRRSAERVGSRRVICGLSGGRRFRRWSRPCSPAPSARSSRASSSTTACCARARPSGSSRSSPTTSRPTCTWSGPRTSSWPPWPAWLDPAGKAAADRARLHRVLLRRGQADRRRPFPRPGDALSGRDRERRPPRRPGRHDQTPPQRRRAARGAGVSS